VLEREHSLRASSVRHRIWMQFYVRGLTPEEAARQAAIYATNALPMAERRRRGV
jgi:hypothetical protein